MLLEKVLVITYYWPPSGGAGVQRALKFVRYLMDYGYLPVVLTVDASKASYPVLDESLYKDVPVDVEVYRTSSFEPLNILSAIAGKKNVPYGGFANANKESLTQRTLRWIRGNFFIPDARVGWVKYAVEKAGEIIDKEGITKVIISSPPHSSQLIGLQLKKKYPELFWIADMRDPWTDIYYYKDLLHTKLAASKDAKYEKEVLESASAILVVSEAIKRTFITKSDYIDPGKIHVIPNGYDEEDFKEEVLPSAEVFTIAYVGTMADTYKPEVFFKTLQMLLANLPKNSIRFRFVGNAPWTLKKLAGDYGLDDYCEWIGHVDHAKAVHFMRTANALLLIIPDSVGAEGILTGKLFEYLGAERLILGIGPSKGDAAEILRKCKAGEMFERQEGDSMYTWLADKIRKWQQQQEIYSGTEEIRKYTRATLTKQVARILGAEIN